jgi:hypothetical protein
VSDGFDQSPRTRWRPRFSLLTALLLITIVGLSIAVAQLWREVGPLRYDVGRLRTEQGLLVIDNKNRAHAIQLVQKPGESNVWSFRVYVPPGRVYRAMLTVHNIPSSGLPDVRRVTGSSILGYVDTTTYADLKDGECLLTVGVYHNQKNIAYVGFTRQGGGAPALTDARTYEATKWPQQNTSGANVSGVHHVTESASENGELVLIRYRECYAPPENAPIDSYVVPDDGPPTDGFMLWIEPFSLPAATSK